MALKTFHLSILGLILAAFLVACGPANKSAQTIKQNDATDQPDLILQQDLVPTWEDPSADDESNTQVSIYEKPSAKIINPQAEIILGQVKMNQVKMSYNLRERKIEVSGSASVLDENKKVIAESSFTLFGSHDSDQNTLSLKPDSHIKFNSQVKPYVRAEATCLDMTENDQYDCSHVVIDFFIAYKKQIFSQQMEVSQVKKIGDQIKKIPQLVAVQIVDESEDEKEVEVVTTKTTDTVPIEADAKTAPPEGAEKSIPGPYNGLSKKANLAEIFEDDEDQVIQPKVVEKPAPVKPTPVPLAEPSKKEIVIAKDFMQLINGDLRPINQSIGFVDKGKLRNSISVLEKQKSLNQKAFFEVKSPDEKNHFATYEMSEMIMRLGEKLNKSLTRKLYVGPISFKNGGRISPHLSHQIGVDVDLGYPTEVEGIKFPIVAATKVLPKANSDKKNRVVTQYFPNHYSVSKTYELLKFAFSQPDIKVERVFIDRTIKKALCEYAISAGEFKSAEKDLVQNIFESIEHVPGHGNHFHLRLKCSAEDPSCRSKLYVKNDGCESLTK